MPLLNASNNDAMPEKCLKWLHGPWKANGDDDDDTAGWDWI